VTRIGYWLIRGMAIGLLLTRTTFARYEAPHLVEIYQQSRSLSGKTQVERSHINTYLFISKRLNYLGRQTSSSKMAEQSGNEANQTGF
jgi:hypothetical protein